MDVNSNNLTEMTTTEVPLIDRINVQYLIGLGLSICSALFIGASFVIKKKSLIRLANSNRARAGTEKIPLLRK